MCKMFFSRRRTNKCQNLGFPKGEDFWWKSALEGKKSVLLITGSTKRDRPASVFRKRRCQDLTTPPTNAHSKIALNLNDYWLKCTQSKKIVPLLFLTTKTKHSPTIIYVLRIVLRVGLRVVYGVIFGYSKHPFEPSQDFAIAQYQLDCLRQHLLLPHLKD
jgi:hypothetical protein